MQVEHVRLWHDQAIWKPGVGADAPPSQAGNIGWHQDFGYWRVASTTNMCTAWIALQDTDLRNGGMRTIVGSHRWGLIEDSAAFFNPDLGALSERFGKYGEWLDEPCVIPAGAASFHHALTFHGSGPNLTDQPRLSLVAHMMPDGTRYRLGQGWHENVVFLGPRAMDQMPFEGPYWPRIV
jgi:ectoine hydroxylase-related dioxygenase (phytanoyl-CoA dioxygenase family)